MTQPQLTDLIRSVTFMRQYQRQYFEARQKGLQVAATEALRKSKGFEARVDALLAEINGANKAQTELFR
jgi:hypothetical protein